MHLEYIPSQQPAVAKVHGRTGFPVQVCAAALEIDSNSCHPVSQNSTSPSTRALIRFHISAITKAVTGARQGS